MSDTPTPPEVAPEQPSPAPVAPEAIAAPQTTPPGQTAQQQANAVLAARIAELKTYEGKTFEWKVKPARFPNQTFKIVRYNGTGVGAGTDGVLAHLFLVECYSPRNIWNAPATKFLEDMQEVQPAQPQPQPDPTKAI